jgi:Peptidase S24-like
MSQLDVMAQRLREGAPEVTFRSSGRSMEPLIHDGEQVTVRSLDTPVEVGDIVLVTVKATTYLHKVLAIDGLRVQIGNSKGRVNGWTHIGNVWGRLA